MLSFHYIPGFFLALIPSVLNQQRDAKFFGHFWYENESTWAKKEYNPRISTSRKIQFYETYVNVSINYLQLSHTKLMLPLLTRFLMCSTFASTPFYILDCLRISQYVDDPKEICAINNNQIRIKRLPVNNPNESEVTLRKENLS